MYTRQTKNVKQNVNQDTETTGTKIHAQEGDNNRKSKNAGNRKRDVQNLVKTESGNAENESNSSGK